MKLKFNGFLTLLLVLITQITFAQDIAVTGTVTDQSGLPIPGVNVLVKGTSNGTQTDFDGKFKLSAKEGQKLVFSFLGMKTQEVSASSSMKVKMTDGSVELEGVVVTALGIKREKKSLGYATQELKGAELTSGASSGNFFNELSGKVAGVAIRRNNNFGGSTNIVSRGIKSLNGSNQMLIVIDGMPINNSNTNSGSGGSTTGAQTTGRGSTYDYGNAAMDINPEDIESVNILKGAAASALYGWQAANGVVMITTKKGKSNKDGNIGVTISSEYITGSIDKKTFPIYQNKYGSGYGKGTSFLGTSPINTVDTSNDASYGDAFDPTLSVYQWDAFTPYSPNYGKATPWVAAKNGPITFFNTPSTLTNNISLEGSNDKSNFLLSFNNSKQNGIMPNSELKKNSLSAKFNYQFNDKLSATAYGNFLNQNTVGRNSTGYGDNILSNFRQWWQVNTDVQELKQVYEASNGQNITWNWGDPYAANLKPIYWDNPYFQRYKNYESDERNRFTGYGKLDYKLTSWLNATGKISTDTYSELREERRSNGSVPTEFGINRLDESSGYQKYTRTFSEQNYDLLFSVKKDFSKSFTFNGVFGGTVVRSRVITTLASTQGGLIVPNLFSLSNGYVSPFALETEINNGVNSYFGTASFGYNDFLFVDGTARKDAFSTLPKGDNSILTTAVSTSYVFSKNLNLKWLNFGKLRAGYSESPQGQIPDFSLIDTYTKNDPVGDNQQYSVSSTKRNPNLHPIKTITKEIGVEMQFFDKRVGFDVSAYKSLSVDQILNVAYSPTSGNSFRTVNAGSIQNKGFEVQLNLTPLKSTNFQWDIFVNWSANRNEVISLREGIPNLSLGSYQGGVSINATVGQPYGTIQGTDYTYLNGEKIVGPNGRYVLNSNSNNIIGNITPDWIGGIRNKVTYKNVSLGFLVDMQKGGDIFSLDQSYGLATGLYDITAGNNELGNPVRSNIVYNDPSVGISSGYAPTSGGVILPGVQANGTPNTVRTPNPQNFGGIYGYARNPNKAFVYDASFVKLREVNITYNLPSKFVSKLKISEMKFSIVGSNLWIIKKNLPYADPESGLSSGNLSSGYSVGSLPTTRNIGCNVTLKF